TLARRKQSSGETTLAQASGTALGPYWCLRVPTWMVGAGRSTRQRVEAHYASARPAVSDDRASASRATQRVARVVEDVHEGDRVEIAPEADDPSGRRPRVGADEARPLHGKEPDALVVTVTAAAVAVERV